MDEFGRLGVQVVGASADTPELNRRWAEQHGLRMPLISDAGDKQVLSAFDVLKPTGTAKRTTFLLEADGTVRRVFTDVNARGHAAEVLAAVREVWG